MEIQERRARRLKLGLARSIGLPEGENWLANFIGQLLELLSRENVKRRICWTYEGNSVTPLIGPQYKRSENPRTNQLPHNPAEIDIGGEVSSKLCGAHFGSIRSRQGLENTPRNAAENLSDLKVNETLGEERDEDESRNSDQRHHHSLPVSEPFAYNTVDEKTEDFSNLGTVGETCLPRSRDLVWVFGFACWITVPFGEGWERIELSQEDDIIPFHDNCGGEAHTEHHGFGIRSEGLHDSHALLRIGGILGLIDEVWHVRIGHGHLAKGGVRRLEGIGISLGHAPRFTTRNIHIGSSVPAVLDIGVLLEKSILEMYECRNSQRRQPCWEVQKRAGFRNEKGTALIFHHRPNFR